MMQQYRDIKNKHMDSLLFFRMGDFYELFGEDAVIASKLLNIALTARHKTQENPVPMCGVPYHSVDQYLAKLIKLGKKVAICEQMSDPKEPGIVQREVVRIVTPGTTFDNSILDNKSSNYLIAITKIKNTFGLAFAEATTGDFQVMELNSFEELGNNISKLNSSECIYDKNLGNDEKFINFINGFDINALSSYELFYDPYKTLINHFGVQNLEGFGVENLSASIRAGGILMQYLKDTQKTNLAHINNIKRYSNNDFMDLDEATLRNLELIFTLRDQNRKGSLFSITDHTITSMGGRMLKFWIIHPLKNSNQINDRLDAVDFFHKNEKLTENLQSEFKKIMDIERIVGKIGCLNVNTRDLAALKNSLQQLPKIKESLKLCNCGIIQTLLNKLYDFSDLVDLLDRSLIDDPPFLLREGGMIKDGYNQELDDLRGISKEGKSFINSLQKKEIEMTKINSLKVSFNKVFGYYIEITKANLKNIKLPEYFIRKQTLVNAERFITPELKEYEEKVLGAEDKIKELEYKLFLEIREIVAKEIKNLKIAAQVIATIDVLSSFSVLARFNNYVKPAINNGDKIIIREGRHPVIEKMTLANEFSSNDTFLDNENNQLLLLTGPNMSGKSTYLRQTALIVLLAQIGSFVPAKEAEIGIIDRIFTRVGASDNLAKGQSTFMVEMQEAANILNYATKKSLIILDEIGRGTSTYDGVSIAWAITEYLHDKIEAKTIFATHYHELTPLVEKLEKGKNLCVSVRENEEEGVVFLHKILEGIVDKSYGIEVAKLAGLPKDVTDRAKTILMNLEEGILEKSIKKRERAHRKVEEKVGEEQISMFK